MCLRSRPEPTKLDLDAGYAATDQPAFSSKTGGSFDSRKETVVGMSDSPALCLLHRFLRSPGRQTHTMLAAAVALCPQVYIHKPQSSGRTI
ncbi:hypothetical protein V2G26_019815 [Clonostachys chloroleuca]